MNWEIHKDHDGFYWVQTNDKDAVISTTEDRFKRMQEAIADADRNGWPGDKPMEYINDVRSPARARQEVALDQAS